MKHSTLIAVVFSILLISLGATYLIAYDKNFSLILGGIRAYGYPIYGPANAFIWYRRGLIGGDSLYSAAVMCSFPMLLGWGVYFNRHGISARASSLHGTARWGTDSELKKEGLFCGQGIVLGITSSGKLITDDSDHHVAVVGPTGTGKSAGVSIPTLLCSTQSALILDVKGELYQTTSAHRSKFSDVIVLDLSNPDGARWNPLDAVRPGMRAVKDAQTIADMVVDPHGQGIEGDGEFWKGRGRSALIAFILHLVVSRGEDKSLPGLTSLFANPGKEISETLEHLLKSHVGGGFVDDVIAQGIRELLDCAPDTQRDILATAGLKLDLYKDPILRQITSSSSFCIEDLVTRDRPVSLYLIVPPSEFQRLRPFVRLLFTMFMSRLYENDLDSQRKQRLLVLMDEYHLLGRLEAVETALAFIRSYKMRALLLTQSRNQLDRVYGTNHSILENCRTKVFYRPNTDETASSVSKMLGRKTVRYTSGSRRNSALSMVLGNDNESEHFTGRDLITSHELLTLKQDEAVVQIAGLNGLKVQIAYWFKYDFFRQMVKAPLALKTVSKPLRREVTVTDSTHSDQLARASLCMDDPDDTVSEFPHDVDLNME